MSEKLRDNHVPGAKWEFDADVTAKFDDMLERSIPGYTTMRDLVFRLGKTFLNVPSNVVDLGASRGEAAARFIQQFPNCQFYLSEVSEPMLDEMRERFAGLPYVHPCAYDLRKSAKDIAVDIDVPQYMCRNSIVSGEELPTRLVLGILTLIFVPVNFRQSIIQGVHDGLAPGGAFFMVEKVLGNSAYMQELLVEAYHEYKHDNGYSWEDIERKRASLEGVQVPLRHEENLEMLRSAGFKHVEVFHRNLNFAGYIAIKGE